MRKTWQVVIMERSSFGYAEVFAFLIRTGRKPSRKQALAANCIWPGSSPGDRTWAGILDRYEVRIEPAETITKLTNIPEREER